ncbi:MAG TPA: response regulator transcription factor [Blastocatellia bacterium]|nr:response regulator transcription factor [Blastocatellia bacterium]HMV83633.1 response regulator transcription factor [Blastocatellia bacterium]HMX29895.1 response regulator transcription factor [Blastocatellia bacterium]HMZ20788.1 response regulator transcription factor [Blastocatellia bacterium]HNG34261.1 response regulator transcription factor [Blastocatellia bacterium]
MSIEPNQSAAPLKVAIIEDHHKFREMLEFLLGSTPGFECTGCFRTMEDALARIGGQLPDVVLLDIGLPGMSGIEGVGLLKARHPNLIVLMNTVYDDDERIFAALCGGASGYLLKKTPPARLLEYLKEAAAGGAPMSPEVARRVLDLFREIRPPEQAEHDLTPHELRLLKLLVDGHSYKTAAGALGVTVKTVSFHLQHIYEKLHVHSKSEAVAKALRLRLIK